MRAALLFLLAVAPPAAAGEADAGHAHPERWTHPSGPASGSGRSLARPPTSFGGILWTYEARRSILAPPLTWDGVAFVFDGRKSHSSLVALDIETGRVIARKGVAGAGFPRPAAFRRSVFFLENGRTLVQYELERKTLERVWAYEIGEGAAPPRIHAGEIYVTGPPGLVRLRVGRDKPVWVAEGRFEGEPAVFGDHVYALLREDGALHLSVRARLDGSESARVQVAESGRGGRVAVSEGMAAALVGKKRWALLQRREKEGKIELEVLRTVELSTQPLVGRRAIVALDSASKWQLYRKHEKHPVWTIVGKEERPDLVVGATSPIVLRDKQCFGTWIADLNANRIFWHLDERREVRTFAKGLHYAAVPAGDERLLVVARGAKTLHLIGPEVIGQ